MAKPQREAEERLAQAEFFTKREAACQELPLH